MAHTVKRRVIPTPLTEKQKELAYQLKTERMELTDIAKVVGCTRPQIQTLFYSKKAQKNVRENIFHHDPNLFAI